MKSPYVKGSPRPGGKSLSAPQEEYEHEEDDDKPVSIADLAETPSICKMTCEFCGANAYPTRTKTMHGCCKCLPDRIVEKAMERFVAGAA